MGLRVGHADWTEQLLPRVLRTLRRRCPDAELAVSPVERPEQAARLRNRGIDIAVSRTPADEADLDCEVLLEEPMFAALSADHPLVKHERIEVGRLSATPFVLFPPELCPCAHQLVNHLCRAGRGHPRGGGRGTGAQLGHPARGLGRRRVAGAGLLDAAAAYP